MSKAKLAAAKELIKEHRYEEARAVLRTVNHPTAYQWLSQLDSRVPPPPPPPPSFHSPLQSSHPMYISPEQERYYIRENKKARRKRINSGFSLIGTGILCFMVYMFWASLPKFTIPGSPSRAASIEVVFIPIGIVAIIAGLYLFTKRD